MGQLCKKIFFLILCTSLVACNSLSSNRDQRSEKKTSTAIINTQLGLAYLQKRDMQRAKMKLVLALKEDPNIPETWYSMALFLETTGENEQAKEYYQKALALAPHRGDVLNNYGTFLCRSGDYKGAIQEFKKATQDIEYIDTASAYENAGLCALKIPDNALAMDYFKRALLQDPNSPTALIELAENDYKIGHYDDAQNKLDEYLAIAPPTAQTNMLKEKLDKRKMTDQPRENS